MMPRIIPKVDSITDDGLFLSCIIFFIPKIIAQKRKIGEKIKRGKKVRSPITKNKILKKPYKRGLLSFECLI